MRKGAKKKYSTPRKTTKKKSTTIMTVGGATQDVFIQYEDAATMHLHTATEKLSYLLLEEGAKIEVTGLRYSAGGGANNAAFSFKKQGFEVTPFFKVGKDAAGQFIIDNLVEADIHSELVIQEEDAATGTSFIIPSLERDRTIFAFRGSNATVTQKELPIKEMSNYDYLYITSLSGKSSQLLPSIAQKAKRNEVIVATNPGSSQLMAGADALRKSLANVDILILNSAESEVLMHSLEQSDTGLKKTKKKLYTKQENGLPLLFQKNNMSSFNIEDFFSTVLSYGTKVVAVTNGAEGVYVATPEQVYFHPSLPVEVENTLGAGDAFGSAFVGALASYRTIEEALRYGIINAASVICHTSTQEGLLSLSALAKEEKGVDKSLLQIFS